MVSSSLSFCAATSSTLLGVCFCLLVSSPPRSMGSPVVAKRASAHAPQELPAAALRPSTQPPSVSRAKAASSANGPCNGHDELCDRRFDEVSYVTTHNAFNYAWGNQRYWFPNQGFDIPRQLASGVRALMIDLHQYNGHNSSYAGQTFVCHSYCELGGEPLEGVLASIAEFLADHPREVVSLIFESYVPYDRVEEAFVQSGLIGFVRAQSEADPWPTLRELIDAGERLIVLTDKDGGSSGWYLDVWKFAVETHYSAQQPGDLNCSYNRGNADNGLFILNHFLTYPLARRSLAWQVNRNPFLVDRAFQCWDEAGKLPNFVTVDFSEIGDVMDTVNTLNGVGPW